MELTKANETKELSFIVRDAYAALEAPTLIGNQVSAPLQLLGTGIGNTSFNLASIGLTWTRYIQIVYVVGEDVELDAVGAIHFNQPPKPTSNFGHWRFTVFGAMFTIFTIVAVIWVRKRSR